MPSFSFMIKSIGSPIVQISAESRDEARVLLDELLVDPTQVFEPTDDDIRERERLLTIINGNSHLKDKVEPIVCNNRVEFHGTEAWVIFDVADADDIIRDVHAYDPTLHGDFWNYIRS